VAASMMLAATLYMNQIQLLL
jgi:hypothetical protein